jgi:hypothetical protein
VTAAVTATADATYRQAALKVAPVSVVVTHANDDSPYLVV